MEPIKNRTSQRTLGDPMNLFVLFAKLNKTHSVGLQTVTKHQEDNNDQDSGRDHDNQDDHQEDQQQTGFRFLETP